MLHAQIRQPKQRLGQYRRAGQLPAIVYGHGFTPIPILLDASQFIKETKRYGEGSLLELKIADQEPFRVLWQDYQKNAVKDNLIHVDLYHIKMDEKLTTKIPLKFIGEAPAVKDGGVLIKNRDFLEVECLPQDLVPEIEINLSSLTMIHSSIKVSDLPVPNGLRLMDQADLNIATIGEAAALEAEATVTKEAEAEAITVLKEQTTDKKKEETSASDKASK